MMRRMLMSMMPYNERLRRYEMEKRELVRSCAGLTAEQFEARLKELQEKWRI